MAVDIHSVNLLRLAQKSGADLSSILTLGHLGLFLDEWELRRFCRETGRPTDRTELEALKGDGFCEAFLMRVFGAKEVVALDASPYDGATMIHDLNTPMPAGRQFSAVLDFGCLEHVFNFPVAIGNAIACCRDGGHLLHVLPTNNWCGHGFYQFSPEVFFNLYSEKRGFLGTQVFLVEDNRPGTWYRLRSPYELKKRINVVNREKTSVLVLTRKTGQAKMPLEAIPQQSDYVAQWSGQEAAQESQSRSPAREARRRITRATGLSAAARAVRLRLRSLRSYLVGHKQRLREGRPEMERLDVGSLLAETGRPGR